jgi:hypothetical protein
MCEKGGTLAQCPGSKDGAMQTPGIWIIELSELDNLERHGQLATNLKWEGEFKTEGIERLADFKAVIEEANGD